MQISTKDLQDLRTLEERLWIAEFRFDREWMELILATDFFEFGRSGRIYSRSECLKIDRGQTINAVIPLQDFKARHIGSDAVQITYTSIVIYGDLVENANRSSLWRKTQTGWKLTFHQGTPTTP